MQLLDGVLTQHPKAQLLAGERNSVRVAPGRPHPVGRAAPTPITQHPEPFVGLWGALLLISLEFLVPFRAGPFPYVAVHIVEAERICRKAFDRYRLGVALRAAAITVRFVRIRIVRTDFVAPGIISF